MQVVTNEQLVASKARIGQIGTIAALVALVVSFMLTLTISSPDNNSAGGFAISYALLAVGLISMVTGRRHSLRFGIRPRPDEILANALKGLDQRHVLLNYSTSAHTNHLLLSPLGLFVIEVRLQDGPIICEGDRCRRKRSFSSISRVLVEGFVGHPAKDALNAVADVKSYLSTRIGAEQAEQVAIEPVIVFTSRLAQLTIKDPIVPIMTPDDLRAHVRSVQGRGKMPPEIYRQLYETFDVAETKAANEARAAEAKSRAKDRGKDSGHGYGGRRRKIR